MFNHIKGTITEKGAGRLVLDAGGIGYEIMIPFSTSLHLPDEGEATVLIHYQMRERPPSVQLYGFATAEERTLFRSLISVPKIGPAKAIQILSSTKIDDFLASVAQADASAISKLKGIGAKTADLLILELQGFAGKHQEGKKAAPVAPLDKPNILAAQAGLRELGCSPKDITRLLDKAVKESGENATPQDLIRTALKYL